MTCRHCKAPLNLVFADLGEMPLSNAMLTHDQLYKSEPKYPLRVLVCERCWLVQTEDFTRADHIFDNTYTYFSSYSQSWLDHAKRYVEMITDRLQLDSSSQVIEIASNDGYLLQYFKEKKIPTLGIEPTANTAAAAREKGIETVTDFFGTKLAVDLNSKGIMADLIIGNNVLAHVPDINDFVSGLRLLLKPEGVITMEFPHVMKLIQHGQFDTIYHEHFSYLSLTAVNAIFREYGLHIFDVEEIPTHGGSMRVYARHARTVIASEAVAERGNPPLGDLNKGIASPDRTRDRDDDHGFEPAVSSVKPLLDLEHQVGITNAAYHEGFQHRINAMRKDFLDFLRDAKQNGDVVAGYGAAAKGNTLLNYCRVTSDMIPFVADVSPHKQGKFLPGSHIPVVHPDEIRKRKPNFVVILPWNIREEVMNQLSYIREWGGRFVVAVPMLEII